MKKKILIGISLILMLVVFLALSPHALEVINARWIFQQGFKVTGGNAIFNTPFVSGTSEIGWFTLTSPASGYRIPQINNSLIYTFNSDALNNRYTQQTTAGASVWSKKGTGVTIQVIADPDRDHGKIFAIQNRTRTGVTPPIIEFVANTSGQSQYYIDSTTGVTNADLDAFGDIIWFQVYAPPSNLKYKTGNSVFEVARYIH